MNILDRVLFEVKVGERTTKLEITPGTSYVELHQVLCMMDEYVVKKIQEAEEAEKAKSEDPKIEVLEG